MASYQNQLDFPLRLQIQRLRQDLAHAQKQIQEYEDILASLYNHICVKCRAHFEKQAPAGLATSSTMGAVIISPSSKPKFSLRPSNSPRSSSLSNRGHFWHPAFNGHHTTPNRPTDSVRSGASQLNVKASDFIVPNRSVSLSSESIQPSSLSVTQHPISLPETNQPDRWSVDFNSDVKPALNVKFEHVLTHGEIVECVRFSPDGKYLAVGVDNGRTYIYDAKTGVKSCFLADNYETTEPEIRSLCFSPDCKYLAVGASFGRLRIWEITKKRTRNIFREHTDATTGLDFSPDGRFLVSSSYDKTVLWRMRDGFSKLLEDDSDSPPCCVKFNPDGRYIAAGNYDGVLMIWNVWTGQLVGKWTAHGNAVRSVACPLGGKGLVSSSSDGTWKYWDISFLELSEPGYGLTEGSMVGQKSKVTVHTNKVCSISISPDGQWVVSGSADTTVRIWSLRNAALQCTLKGHKGGVWSVDFCPTGNYLASGSRDGQVAVWRYEAA